MRKAGRLKHVTANMMIDGLYSNRNDRNKLSDKIVHLLSFLKANSFGHYTARLAHHCTVLGPNFMELSADLFGEMRRLLTGQFRVPVLMAQGNAGDMGNKQYRQSNLFDEVERQALAITDQILKKARLGRGSSSELDYRPVTYHASYDIHAQDFVEKKAEFENSLKQKQILIL